MYKKQTCHQGCAVCQLNRVLAAGCVQLAAAVLLWNTAHADTDEFSTVSIRDTANRPVDGQPLDIQNPSASELVEVNHEAPVTVDNDKDLSELVQFDTAELDQESRLDLVASPDTQSVDVADTGSPVKLTNPVDDISSDVEIQNANLELGDQNEVSEAMGVDAVGVESLSTDVVQLDAGGTDQNSRLELTGSQDLRALDVVESGTSVQFPQVVDGIATDNDPEDMNVESGDRSVAGLNELKGHDDQRLATSAGAKLPVSKLAVDAGSLDGKPLNDVSDDVVSEESAGLPYAVVLALLALIGLVPVARRNDHHHV